jgi:hypothetical protein
MASSPTDIQILFTNYDIITYFLNLAFCSEHFISIKHRILATFNINKKIQFWQPVLPLNIKILWKLFEIFIILNFFKFYENFEFFVYCHKYQITVHPYGVEFHQ